MKDKGGRPTVMTEETIAKLEEGFTMGFSDIEACLYANISKDSLYRYCKEHQEFSNRKEELKNHPRLLAKRNIYNSLTKGEKTDDSKWYLERRDRDFKQKQDITSDDKPIAILANVSSNNSNQENNEPQKED